MNGKTHEKCFVVRFTIGYPVLLNNAAYFDLSGAGGIAGNGL